MMLYIPNNINIDVIYIYTQCYWGLIMIKRGNGKSF